MTYPQGGFVEYEYNDVEFDVGPVDVEFRVITKRKTGGRDISAGTWTYNYTDDFTTINAPDGLVKQYVYFNWNDTVSNGYSGTIWKIGQLLSQKIYQSGSLIYSKVLSWNKSSQSISRDDISNAAWSGTIGFIHDREIYVPILTSSVITQDGKSYTTTFSDYDNYGNPRRLVESGDK